MRFTSLEEWNRYLNSQFLDKQGGVTDDREGKEEETRQAKPTDPAEATSPDSATVQWREEEPDVSPRVNRRMPEDPLGNIPAIEDFMPWLSTVEPVEGVQAPASPVIPEMKPPEPLPSQYVVEELSVEPTASQSVSRAASGSKGLSAPRPRWKVVEPQLVGVSDTVPDERLPEALMGRLPSHMRFLARVSGYRSAPPSAPKRRRRRDETRLELIERLADPVLTLDETAVLLGVCPTTIRRYTQKGWISHHRTKGGQRRFRLSDIAAFLEQHGRVPR